MGAPLPQPSLLVAQSLIDSHETPEHEPRRLLESVGTIGHNTSSPSSHPIGQSSLRLAHYPKPTIQILTPRRRDTYAVKVI